MYSNEDKDEVIESLALMSATLFAEINKQNAINNDRLANWYSKLYDEVENYAKKTLGKEGYKKYNEILDDNPSGVSIIWN